MNRKFFPSISSTIWEILKEISNTHHRSEYPAPYPTNQQVLKKQKGNLLRKVFKASNLAGNASFSPCIMNNNNTLWSHKQQAHFSRKKRFLNALGFISRILKSENCSRAWGIFPRLLDGRETLTDGTSKLLSMRAPSFLSSTKVFPKLCPKATMAAWV